MAGGFSMNDFPSEDFIPKTTFSGWFYIHLPAKEAEELEVFVFIFAFLVIFVFLVWGGGRRAEYKL